MGASRLPTFFDTSNKTKYCSLRTVCNF